MPEIGPPPTGGVDIGPIGQLTGRVIGLNAMTDLGTAAAAGMTSLYMQRRAARKAGKDYNDQPANKTVGAQGNQAVKDVSWMPAP
jgi:hypothetical protein